MHIFSLHRRLNVGIIGRRNKLVHDGANSNSRSRLPVGYFLLCAAFLLAGCASQPKGAVPNNDISQAKTQNEEVQDLNRKIVESAVSSKRTTDSLAYRLGAGDLLQLTVFRVPELNRKVRLNADGQIMLPLLGALQVGGLTLLEAERLITEKLKADYLQDPQVSLFVEDYRSQEITVMGAVERPDVYSVEQSRSIFEMLSLAGGISKTAGDLIRVKTRQPNASSGELETLDVVMSLKKLLAGGGAAASFRLHGGDTILIPEAGYVTLEGAVQKPGSYKMVGETNVLKAIALAGGIPWTGKQNRVKIIRNVDDELVVIDVNLNRVRENPNQDVVLQDGDVVSVNHSLAKRAFAGFFRSAGQILGYRIN